MTYHQQFESQFKRERRLLSLLFVVLMLVVGGIYALDHSQELTSMAAQAYENPAETFSSVIRGMAP
ncbi:MAG: hypothetical protein AB7J40_04500 [Candidatus Altimarinota bacterium]